MWTAGVVLCTLLINAPALPFVLRVTGLTKVSLLTLQSRDKARQQFLKFTNDCITGMQQNADERMQVWAATATASSWMACGQTVLILTQEVDDVFDWCIYRALSALH